MQATLDSAPDLQCSAYEQGLVKYADFKARAGWFVDTVHWILAFMPILWFALVYGYAIRARAILGYWPTPYNPDPKTKVLADVLSFHYELTWAIANLAFSAFIAFILLIPLCRFFNRNSRLILRSLVCAGVYAASFAWIYFDPGQFIEWYFD